MQIRHIISNIIIARICRHFQWAFTGLGDERTSTIPGCVR